MLHHSQHLQSHIKRTIDNIKHQSKSLKADQLLSPFTYCSHLLTQYAQQSKPHQINSQLFKQFRLQVVELSRKDTSKFKIHHTQIFNQIINIIDSDLFQRSQNTTIKRKINSKEYYLNTKQTKKTQDQSDFQELEIDKPLQINLPKTIKKLSICQKNKIDFSSTIIPQLKSTSSSQNIIIDQQQSNLMYAKLLNAYKQHRIDEAFRLKNIYQNKYTMNSQIKKLFSTIELQYNTMISFYKEFDQQGWQLDKQENGTRLQYKIFQAQKQVGVRVQAEVNVPIDHFLAILSQIDLFEKYVPFVYDSRQLKVISRNQKIGTSKVFIPCLSDRQVYFYAAGYDRIKQNGSVFLFSKTLNDDKIYQKKYEFQVPTKTDYVRLQYKFYIIQYIPIGLNKAKIRLAVRVDMKLNYLPQFIINISARKFAFDYFKNIPKLSRKFKGSDWEKKINQNPQFYEFFKQKIQQYVGKNDL